MLSSVEASVAATGPTGVAFQIHHTVAAFHPVKTSSAQPKTRHHERRDASYEKAIHSSGTKAVRRGMPVRPSHPAERRSTERRTAADRRNMWGVIFTRAKVIKASYISK